MQVDLNGQRTLYRPIGLGLEGQLPVLFPNPVGSDGQLRLEPALAYRRYELVDAPGRIIEQQSQPGQLSQLWVGG